MEILFNEESGKYYPEGKDQDFIHTILAFLYANGVRIINENTFIQNLIYYRDDPRFKEWFQTIGKLDFYNGFDDEKRGNLEWVTGSEFVYLTYQNELDNYKKYQELFQYERYLKDEINKLLRLTEELTTISLIEQEHKHSIRIYVTDPNKRYSLVKTPPKPFSLFDNVESTFLITDGDTTILNPSSSDCLETKVENAMFAMVLPADYNGHHNCVDIYTKIPRKKQLQRLATVGVTYRGKKDELLSDEAYVKKLSF